MILYAIHYNSRPRIRFACATTVETEVPKRNIIDHRKNIIELAYYTGDAFSLQVDETLYPIAQSDIFLIMPPILTTGTKNFSANRGRCSQVRNSVSVR